jgi:N-acetylmuramoyl-L-alanine amidase
MKKLEYIIVHCSDSEWGSAREIRKWHLERGWKDIGYHLVILNSNILPHFSIPCLNGSIELGRPFDGSPFIEDNEIGAHALGYNDRSIGICGVAKAEWHPSQIASLISLLRCLMKIFGIKAENILGHCETESGKKEGKTCPNLDMDFVRREISDPPEVAGNA